MSEQGQDPMAISIVRVDREMTAELNRKEDSDQFRLVLELSEEPSQEWCKAFQQNWRSGFRLPFGLPDPPEAKIDGQRLVIGPTMLRHVKNGWIPLAKKAVPAATNDVRRAADEAERAEASYWERANPIFDEFDALIQAEDDA